MISLNDVEVYIGENLLFPTTYTMAKSVKKSLEQNEEEMLSVDKSIGIYAPDGEMESIFFCNHELENTSCAVRKRLALYKGLKSILFIGQNLY